MLEVLSAKISGGVLPGIEGDIDPGDRVEVTLGKEVYSPVKYNTFEVGPIVVGTRVRPGETGAGAAARARALASVLFQAEFELKRGDYFSRLKELGER